MTVRTRIAWWLRILADHIDPERAPRRTGMTFTFEYGKGVVLRYDGRGCPLWYLSRSDYRRAHAEADTRWGS